MEAYYQALVKLDGTSLISRVPIPISPLPLSEPPRKVHEQAGVELCQAQESLGLLGLD